MDKRRLKVLVIEDNPGDFLLVEEYLLEQIEVPAITHVECCKEAVDLLTCPDNRFDVVLLDITLPDGAGEQLIDKIVKECPETPVIVLTGYSDFAFSVKSIALGASDYLLKDELTGQALYKCIIYSMERKRIVAELEDSEKKYSDLFHLSPLPMWVFDVKTLMFLDVNAAAINHYGYSKEEFTAMSIRDIRPAAELPKLDAVIEAYQTQKLSKTGVFTHRKKSGELIEVEIQSNRLNYKGFDAKIILAVDVTERFKYIKAVEDQNRRLKEISWIQSHIIRAPLSRIMGLIPLITDPAAKPEDRNMMLGFLKISAEELDSEIREITDKSNADLDKPTNLKN